MITVTGDITRELCLLLKEEKYILLHGGLGVGKTYLAKQVAKHFVSFIGEKRKKMKCEIIPIHRNYSYEDFINGMIVSTLNNQIIYHKEDKIFLNTLKAAAKDKRNYYLLILDDINRGNVTGILGDFLTALESHGDEKHSIVFNEEEFVIPDNLYIIATQNELLTTNYADKYALNRRFYHYYISTDIKYLNEEISDKWSAKTLYNKINDIIRTNYDLSLENFTLNQEIYLLGHGMFLKPNFISQVKYQCIPILLQYVKEGILTYQAFNEIQNLKQSLSSEYIKSNVIGFNVINVSTTTIEAQKFINEGTTHIPLMNLITRIKQQGLLSDSEILNCIIHNNRILQRKGQFNGQEIIGNLFIDINYFDSFKLGKRNLYRNRKGETIEINGHKYCVAGEMQPGEYFNWDDGFLGESYINGKNSTSPNSILFLMVKNYYEELLNKYQGYYKKNRNDINIKYLLDLIEEELNFFINRIKKVKAKEYNINNLTEEEKKAKRADIESKYNQEANKLVREIIGDLKILWANRSEKVKYKDKEILIEGVYRMTAKNIYKEYYETMTSLQINQMIIQGPPGTSKTYSVKKFLQYIGAGIENDSYLNDKELEQYQIINYYNSAQYNTYASKNSGKSPIAWDIVQFHPSYGYEDFIRGIEVSTKKETNAPDAKSFVSYETVNKILGKMASLAASVPDTKFFLVIDEINRANLATVFGELIYGLEYRGEAVATPYSIEGSNKLSLPENLYIIGTMNTADKSIGGIDYAIRRRFLFFSLLPDENVIKEYSPSSANDKAENLFKNISKLFDSNILCEEYYKEDVQLGHTYFLVEDEGELFKRFKYQIIPILKEYNRDGMFQLNIEDDSHEGWSGFLKCLTGDIKVGRDDKEIKKIYDVLVTSESV